MTMTVGESQVRPRVWRGELQVYESQQRGAQATVIPFQYNPENLRRSIASRTPPAQQASNPGRAREEVFRVLGPPVETINLSVVLDAADQLGEPNPDRRVVENGLYPVISTLDLLLYPPSRRLSEDRQQARSGRVQTAPAEVPLVLLKFGPARIAPVMLTSYSVAEEAFDPRLNPIQARVELGMRVLTNVELREGTIGYDAYVGYQREKERLAYPPGAANGSSTVATRTT
jgi:hypothetical protein